MRRGRMRCEKCGHENGYERIRPKSEFFYQYKPKQSFWEALAEGIPSLWGLIMTVLIIDNYVKIAGAFL
jgi:hypothetical protein